MASQAEERRAKELLNKSSRLSQIVESTADAAKELRQFIKTCQAEGLTYREIGKAIDLPAYCIRVIMGETKRNRVLPEYARNLRK